MMSFTSSFFESKVTSAFEAISATTTVLMPENIVHIFEKIFTIQLGEILLDVLYTRSARHALHGEHALLQAVRVVWNHDWR